MISACSEIPRSTASRGAADRLQAAAKLSEWRTTRNEDLGSLSNEPWLSEPARVGPESIPRNLAKEGEVVQPPLCAAVCDVLGQFPTLGPSCLLQTVDGLPHPLSPSHNSSSPLHPSHRRRKHAHRRWKALMTAQAPHPRRSARRRRRVGSAYRIWTPTPHSSIHNLVYNALDVLMRHGRTLDCCLGTCTRGPRRTER